MLDPEDGAAIKRVQQLLTLTKYQLKTDVSFIHANLFYLSLTIVKLEKESFPLSESIKIIK